MEDGAKREEQTDPIGVKVSKPLTVDQGRPLFFTSSCMLRAVMSTAKARKKSASLIFGLVGVVPTVSSNVSVGSVL